METSFRSRLRILFDCVLSYTQVNQPIVPCFKFDLQVCIPKKNKKKIDANISKY